MIGKCNYCGETKRINKKTMFCAPCLRQFQETTEEHFDGNPLQPFEFAVGDIQATIGSYEDRGSYVIVDIGDGEELANSLEEMGIPVTRLSILDVLKDPEDNA